MDRLSRGVVSFIVTCAVVSVSVSACDGGTGVDKPLGFKTADGSTFTDCPKRATERDQCEACCAAVEPNLTKAQAAQVLREVATHADRSKLSFSIPEPFWSCLRSCGFAELQRKFGEVEVVEEGASARSGSF